MGNCKVSPAVWVAVVGVFGTAMAAYADLKSTDSELTARMESAEKTDERILNQVNRLHDKFDAVYHD